MSDTPEALPEGAHVISHQDMNRLAVTDDGRLLWDGRPVKTERQLTFTFWPALAAAIVAISAFAQGVAAFYQMGIGLGWWATVIVGSSK